MKILILLACVAVLVYILFFAGLEKTNISIGPFSFVFLHDQRNTSLSRAVEYVESYDIDKNKNRSALVALEKAYFDETVSQPLSRRAYDLVLQVFNREPKRRQIRRLLANLFAKKMGMLSAAEREIRSNLTEKMDYKDLIFLGEILSLRVPDDNDEIIKQFRAATATSACKRDRANYQNALNNIDLREGHLLFNKGNFNEALGKYLAVVERNPRSYTAYLSLANSYANTGNPTKALEYYDNAIIYSTTDADSSIALYLKGRVLFAFATELDPHKNNETLANAMRAADLAVKLGEEQYSGFPLGSFQRNALADQLFLRGSLYQELGDKVAADMDFRAAAGNTVDARIQAECEKAIEEITTK